MYRSRPKPNGCSGVARRRAERPPRRSSPWLPESATEWTPSASIEDDPVMANAMNLMTAMPRFAPSAAMTALLLPPELISALSSVRPLGRPRRPGIEPPPEGQVGRGELAEGRRGREPGQRVAVGDVDG